MSNVANPEFGSDCAKAFGEGAGEDVVGAVVIVGFSDEFREELAGLVVVGEREEDLIAAAQGGVHVFQERIATANHLVVFKRVVGNIGVPALIRAFGDFEKTDCSDHFVYFLRIFCS